MNKGFWNILLSAIILGMFGIFITHLAGYFSVYEQIILRSVIAFLCSLAVAVWYKESFSFVDIKIYKLWFIVFLIAFPLSLIFFTKSVVDTNATVSIFLLYAGSLIATFILGKLFFREQKKLIDLVSLFLCLIGIVIFAQLRNANIVILSLLPGLCAGLLEGSVHSARRGMNLGMSRSVLLSYQHFSTIILCLIVGWITGSFHSFSSLVNIPLSVWGYGIVFGLLLCIMSWTLLQGFRHYDVNKGTILLSSELLFATVFNLLFLSVVPNLYELVGGAFIGIASILPLIKDLQIKR